MLISGNTMFQEKLINMNTWTSLFILRGLVFQKSAMHVLTTKNNIYLQITSTVHKSFFTLAMLPFRHVKQSAKNEVPLRYFMDNSIVPALWLHCYYYLRAAEADELCQRMAVKSPHKAGFIPQCSVVEKCSIAYGICG